MTIFYSVLFSLSDPKQNLYCQMLQLQLAALRATKTLKETDSYVLMVDPPTADYLTKTLPLPRQVQLLKMPGVPKTILEGMLWRYAFPTFWKPAAAGDVCVYLDLDMLSWREADFTASEDCLLAYPEGPPTDTNYAGQSPLPLPAGLSSGFFVYRYGKRVCDLFFDVVRAITAQAEKGEAFYTLDQPHYNHAVARHSACVKLMPAASVSFNGNTNLETACFLNCAGDPGDGPFHFQKMLSFFVRRFVA